MIIRQQFTFEDLTDPTVDLEPIQSSYAGSNRNVMEVVHLTVDHNCTLFISVVENYFGVEVSKSKTFSTSQSLTIVCVIFLILVFQPDHNVLILLHVQLQHTY